MHLSDEYIQECVLKDFAFSEEDSKHLDLCSYCRERYTYYQEYYENLDTLMNEPESNYTGTMGQRFFPENGMHLLPGSDNKIIPHPTDKKLIRPDNILPSIRYYANKYPKTFAGGFLGLAAALVFAVISFGKFNIKNNIIYAEARNGFLMAFNTQGDRVWSKFINEGFDGEKIKTSSSKNSIPKYLIVEDINGDGNNEILFTKTYSFPDFNQRKKLYCFIVTDLNNDGEKEIYAIAGHNMYFPTFIVRVDPANGKELSAYYHPGGLMDFVRQPARIHGKNVLIAFGENNAFDKAALVALAYGQIAGYGYSDSSRTPIGMSPAKQTEYLLLPPCLPPENSSAKRNRVIEMHKNEYGTFSLSVLQELPNTFCNFLFFLDSGFTCTKVDASDNAFVETAKLKKTGNFNLHLDSTYFDYLKSGVKYLH
ncbi:MAG: hypothetical protein HYV28_09760 [Ignavibacteriales bacterium]|nr:hypothetical protein [Ignavibacteriales bacterium]